MTLAVTRIIGARRHHDHVVAAAAHDDGDARRALDFAQKPCIDAIVLQALAQPRAENIDADAAQERDLAAGPRRRHRLVAALAARETLKRAAQQGLAGPGQAIRERHQIHIGAADDQNIGCAHT